MNVYNHEFMKRLFNRNFIPSFSIFENFKYAHNLTDTPEAVALATQCVIQDFNAENVVYVELRSTPRCTLEMTKDDYIMAVIQTIL